MMCFAPRLGVFFANWIVINKQNPESDAVRIIKHQWFCASYPCLGGGQKLSKLVAMRNDPPSFLLKKIEYQVEPGYWAVEEETGEEGFESLFAEDDFWVNWSQRFAAILDAVFLMGHPANDCPAVKGRDVSFQRWGAHRHEYHESCCLAGHVAEHKDKVFDHTFIQRPNEVCTGIIVQYNEDPFGPIRPLLIHEAFSRRSSSKGCRKLRLHVAMTCVLHVRLSGPFFKGALDGYLVIPHDFLNF